jgi:hypothetical protein
VAPARHLTSGVDAAVGGRIFVSTPGDPVEVLEDANVRAITERGPL